VLVLPAGRPEDENRFDVRLAQRTAQLMRSPTSRTGTVERKEPSFKDDQRLLMTAVCVHALVPDRDRPARPASADEIAKMLESAGSPLSPRDSAIVNRCNTINTQIREGDATVGTGISGTFVWCVSNYLDRLDLHVAQRLKDALTP
jgi:hypothetical protein